MTSVVTAVASEEKEKRRLLQRQREEVIELRPGRAAGITAAIQVARFSEFVRIVVLMQQLQHSCGCVQALALGYSQHH